MTDFPIYIIYSLMSWTYFMDMIYLYPIVNMCIFIKSMYLQLGRYVTENNTHIGVTHNIHVVMEWKEQVRTTEEHNLVYLLTKSF